MSGMNDILGEKLSELTSKPLLACKGFLRLAIKDEFESATANLSVDTWEKVIRTRLGERLAKINISNIDQIIAELSKELYKNQSILTIANA